LNTATFTAATSHCPFRPNSYTVDSSGSAKREPVDEVRRPQPRGDDRRQVGGQRTAVARQVDRARLEAGRIGRIDVDRVGQLVRRTDAVREIAVVRLAGLDRVGHVQERRQELERLEPVERIDRRVVLVGVRELLHARRNLTERRRVRAREGPDFGCGRGAAQAKHVADLLCQAALEEQLVAERRIGGGVEVDAREDVAADDVGRKALTILRIVAAERQRQPVGDFEIERTEDRERLVLQAIGFVETVAGTEEAARIFRGVALERTSVASSKATFSALPLAARIS
jgi:hypothetical protein